jgi:hypothetical protein
MEKEILFRAELEPINNKQGSVITEGQLRELQNYFMKTKPNGNQEAERTY